MTIWLPSRLTDGLCGLAELFQVPSPRTQHRPMALGWLLRASANLLDKARFLSPISPSDCPPAPAVQYGREVEKDCCPLYEASFTPCLRRWGSACPCLSPPTEEFLGGFSEGGLGTTCWE